MKNDELSGCCLRGRVTEKMGLLENEGGLRAITRKGHRVAKLEKLKKKQGRSLLVRSR